MESLRPERDELDQFKKRQAPKKKGGNKSSRVEPASNGVKVAPPGSGDRVISARKHVAPAPGPSIFSLLLMLVVLAGLGGGAWLYWQQQLELTELRQNLADATGFIGQSKLLMARMEGELSETGAELEQSGSAAEKKLAFLDSEMRKLWGVTNDRNKKLIRSNSEQLESVSLKLEKLSDQYNAGSKASKGQLSELQGGVSKIEAAMAKSLSILDGRVSGLAGEVSITRAEQEDVLADLQKIVSDVKSEVDNGGLKQASQIKKLLVQAKNSETSIESINASRLQLNQRVVDLERKLNDLQLHVKGAQSARDVQ